MGKNKLENIIFVLMICIPMVFIMSCYNVLLLQGFSSTVISHAVAGFIPAFIFALIGDMLVVGVIARKIVSKIVSPTDSLKKKGICMSLLMVCGMVLWMSFFGSVVNVGFNDRLLSAYATGIVKNFIVALPLNLLIISPIMRTLFFKVFPPVKAKSVA